MLVSDAGIRDSNASCSGSAPRCDGWDDKKERESNKDVKIIAKTEVPPNVLLIASLLS